MPSYVPNYNHVEHIATSRIYSWESHLRHDDCNSATLSASVESISLQDGLRSAGHRKHTCDDKYRPPETLHAFQRAASEIESNEKIAEAEATVQSKGQYDIDDDQTDKEQEYDTDIVQAEIAALGGPAEAEIQSKIEHEIIIYHANHFFTVLPEQVDIAIEHTLATCLPWNEELIRLKVNDAVLEAIEDTIRISKPTLPFVEQYVERWSRNRSPGKYPSAP